MLARPLPPRRRTPEVRRLAARSAFVLLWVGCMAVFRGVQDVTTGALLVVTLGSGWALASNAAMWFLSALLPPPASETLRRAVFAGGLTVDFVATDWGTVGARRAVKSPPGQADTQAKTLLGRAQRDWLLETLAEFQVSVPEVGTFTTEIPPYVILTSNKAFSEWGSVFADDVSGANVRYRQSVVPVLSHEAATAAGSGSKGMQSLPSVRPTARPEPFSVCTSSGLPFSLRKRACMRRAWNASQLLHEEISRYLPCPGSQTSMS